MATKDTSTSSNLLSLAKTGRWVIGLSAAAIFAYVCYLIAVPAEAYAVMARGVPFIQTPPSNAMIFAAALVTAIPVAAFLYGLLQAWKFFGEVKNRQPYSVVAQHSLQKLGRAAIACAVTSVLARTAVGLLLTSANPPGQKMLLIEFTSNEIASLLIAVLVFIFANVVREAAALVKENEMYI